MIIQSLDAIVNAIPNCSSSIACQLLVDNRLREDPLGQREPVFGDIIVSRIGGYIGGVGVQAAAIGGFTGYQTNSVLIGVGAGVSSAVAPVAVKLMSIIGRRYF
jgi:hypothetical protein